MKLVVEKNGPIFKFTRDNVILEFDITNNTYYKYYNGIRKEVTLSTTQKFFVNLDIDDLKKGCVDKNLYNFLDYIEKHSNHCSHPRISNIGTILSRVEKYSPFERLASAGIYTFNSYLDKSKVHNVYDVNSKQLLDYARSVGAQAEEKYAKLPKTSQNLSLMIDETCLEDIYENISQKILSKLFSDYCYSAYCNYKFEDGVKIYTNLQLTKNAVNRISQILDLYNDGRFSHLKKIDEMISLLVFGERNIYNTINSLNYKYNGYNTDVSKGINAIHRINILCEDYNHELIPLIEYLHYLTYIENIDIIESVGLYLDYIKMNRNAGRKDKYIQYLKSNHDIIANNDKILNAKYNIEKYYNRYTDICSKYMDEIKYKNIKYFFSVPNTPNDIKHEHVTLRHCVASYINDFIECKCVLLFMRTEDGIPLLTIEIVDNTIVQCRGFMHRMPNDDELSALKIYANKNNLKISLIGGSKYDK